MPLDSYPLDVTHSGGACHDRRMWPTVCNAHPLGDEPASMIALVRPHFCRLVIDGALVGREGERRGSQWARDRLWRVPENFWIFQRRSRWMRTLLVEVEGEPAQKGPAGKRSAHAFQRQVIECMEQYGRYPFTGPVALDLTFTSRRRSPPMIHHAAKHALDVLGHALPEHARPCRRHVLYRDDRQVKFLFVNLRQTWEPSDGDDADRPGATFLVARRGRDAIADLRAAYRLHLERNDCDEEVDDSDPFHVPDLPDDTHWDWPPERPHEPTPSQAWLDQRIRLHHQIELQESILGRTDALLASALAAYLDRLDDPDWPTVSELLGVVRSRNRDLMLSSPLTLPLPGLPRAHGASKEFIAAVRECMQDFRTRRPLLGALHVPVKLTFLVVPSEQGKDLDNIALAVLPIAHDVLRPHIEPHLLWSEHPERVPEPWLETARRRLRSLNADSVAAYQVIELPRSAQDPPEGVLRLALGQHSYESWWDIAADYLDDLIERDDRR